MTKYKTILIHLYVQSYLSMINGFLIKETMRIVTRIKGDIERESSQALCVSMETLVL